MSQSRHLTAPRVLTAGLAVAAAMLATDARAEAPSPEIRLSPTNRIPSCASPERLTQFLKSRNERLDPRFADIAQLYREQGNAWRVRWDYAFFQMIVETNALAFRRGNGEPGDVKPRQNNFAGIGTTGGGVPGDSFPDVRTGVAAHIQHLVAYSGERLAEPVAPRTQLKQDDIVEVSLRLRRAVRFSDLARRWAVDRRYWQSIEAVAGAFRAAHCTTAADLAPAPEAKAVAMTASAAAGKAHVAANTSGLPPPAGLGGEPRVVRAATAAESRPAGQQRASGPVRTVWRGAEPLSGHQAAQQAGPQVASEAPQQQAAAPKPVEVAAASTAAQMDSASAGAAERPMPPPTLLAPPTAAKHPAERKFAFAASGFAATGAPAPAGASARQAPPVQPATASSQPNAVTGSSHSAGAACAVTTASYGGRKALLIRSETEGRVRFTALSVLDGFEASMADSYIRAHAPGGRSVGAFDSSAAALAHAQELCRGNQLSADAR